MIENKNYLRDIPQLFRRFLFLPNDCCYILLLFCCLKVYSIENSTFADKLPNSPEHNVALNIFGPSYYNATSLETTTPTSSEDIDDPSDFGPSKFKFYGVVPLVAYMMLNLTKCSFIKSKFCIAFLALSHARLWIIIVWMLMNTLPQATFAFWNLMAVVGTKFKDIRAIVFKYPQLILCPTFSVYTFGAIDTNTWCYK